MGRAGSMISSLCSASQSSRGSAKSPVFNAGAVLAAMGIHSLIAAISCEIFWTISGLGLRLHAVQNDYRGRGGQRLPGNPQRTFAADVDLELLADALHEL